MDVSPFEKLCTALIGGMPGKVSGCTTSDLAKCLGIDRNSLYRWPLVAGSRVRVIPLRSANIIEKLSGGAVTADEIREFAKQHQAGGPA